MRHFEGFFKPVIIQCDKEMGATDVRRQVTRERNARTVLRFAPNTSHQSNGFVEAVHGHIQGLARCYQTQIETHIDIQLAAISPAIPFAIRCDGLVLSRFTVRPDGRTPFQYLLGTPCVTPLCMCAESVFALIPNHEVRAKLTNRWISGCWWRRDASSDEHLVETKHGLLKCRSVRRNLLESCEVDVKRSRLEGRSGILRVEMDSGVCRPPVTSRPDEGMPTSTAPWEIPTVPPPCHPPPEEHVPENARSRSARESTQEQELGEPDECGGQDEDGDKRDPSFADPAKTKVIGKVIRYTDILGAPVPDLVNEDDKLIDSGQIIIAQKLQERKNDI